MSTARWLWVAVGVAPIAVGAAIAVVAIGSDCDLGFDAGFDLFFGAFVFLPLLVAGWGALAGATSLRARGPAVVVAGALGGAMVGLLWGFFALLATAEAFAAAGCD